MYFAVASECNKLTARQDDFLEPYVFTKANRFVLDSRDDAPIAYSIQPAFDNAFGNAFCMNCNSHSSKHLNLSRYLTLRKEATKLVLLTAKAFAVMQLFQRGPLQTGRLRKVSMS